MEECILPNKSLSECHSRLQCPTFHRMMNEVADNTLRLDDALNEQAKYSTCNNTVSISTNFMLIIKISKVMIILFIYFARNSFAVLIASFHTNSARCAKLNLMMKRRV